MIINFFLKEERAICKKKSINNISIFFTLGTAYSMKVMGFMLSYLPPELSFLPICAAHLLTSWSVKEMRSVSCQFFNLSNSRKVGFPFVLCF